MSYVESYNGTTWAAQSATRTGQFLVTPPNTTDATLLGASCPSAGACQLVGIYGNSGGSIDSIWAAGFDGRAWAPEANPYVFANATFQGVSCASSRDCWAVGSYVDFWHNHEPLGDYWNGSSWQLAAIDPVGSADVFDAISCPTISDCEAVGSTSVVLGQTVPLAERYTSGCSGSGAAWGSHRIRSR